MTVIRIKEREVTPIPSCVGTLLHDMPMELVPPMGRPATSAEKRTTTQDAVALLQLGSSGLTLLNNKVTHQPTRIQWRSSSSMWFPFLRLPFGIASAPEVYHRTVHQIFEGIPGVDTGMDDIIVWGSDKDQHDKRLRQVLSAAREMNVKLNKAKCELGVNQLIFIGDLLTDNGVKQDPAKVSPLKNMQKPQSKNATLSWAWNSIKEILAKEPVLAYYDSKKEIKIAADASQSGLGSVVLQLYGQDWKPVAYASRSMTSAETNYAQIEKELLALTFACERFHQYIFGRTASVDTDHKPLIPLFLKPLNECPMRNSDSCYDYKSMI
ncbi:hypothetical protein BSL78_13379 [Apostichopus japonicus]|uniref:Reverse transcriptase domain-containing protein n=1 Tax=Stichopus japonicus TaxID=307972 RepID=A0A2G8KP15_STIJA|nr:hypothetical protein BSL78_13379 [Apostichopus japonicus]